MLPYFSDIINLPYIVRGNKKHKKHFGHVSILFSSFNDGSQGASITINEPQLLTMIMFNFMTKKKVNWTKPPSQAVVFIDLYMKK